MNILHLCNKFPFPGRDGSSIAMESLIRLEGLLGHHIHVLALNTDKHYVDSPEQPTHVAELDAPSLSIVPSLNNFFQTKHWQCSYFASRFYQPSIAASIEKASRSADLTVIDSLFMAVYRKHIHGPVLLRCHNIEHQIWEETLKHMSLKGMAYAWEVKRLKTWENELLSSMPTLAISEEDAYYIRSNGGRCTVIPSTWSDLQWSLSGASSPSVYHLGAMDWEPNIKGMQWLMDEVLPHLSTVDLHVLSKTQPPAFRQLPKGITWTTEHVADNWFDDHGIFIAPILSGSGMRIKILEAMARGKAVVTTPIGAAGIKATAGKHLMVAHSAEAFAVAMEDLQQDEGMRLALGQAARLHAMTHFLDNVHLKGLDQALTAASHG
jgi:hypothetical protein